MSTSALAATTDDDLSPSQRERRLRMLEAARALAAKGGFDGVQMRDVADRADVALGTLYRYFPSKVHLLVALMHHETRGLTDRLERRPVEGATAADRVVEQVWLSSLLAWLSGRSSTAQLTEDIDVAARLLLR